jgi:hypothetical protein
MRPDCPPFGRIGSDGRMALGACGRRHQQDRSRPRCPVLVRAANDSDLSPEGAGRVGNKRLGPGPLRLSVRPALPAGPGSAVYDMHLLLPPFATGVNPYGELALPIFERVSFRLWLVGSENLVAGQHASSDVVGHVAVELPDPGVVGDHVGHYHAGG